MGRAPRPGGRGAPAAEARVPECARRILLTEDDATCRAVATRILQRAGYDVVTANTGREVLGMPENGAAVDIVLMDLQRPVLDGLVATRRLREDPRWVDPPVIALTAHATGQR